MEMDLKILSQQTLKDQLQNIDLRVLIKVIFKTITFLENLNIDDIETDAASKLLPSIKVIKLLLSFIGC